MQIKGSRIISSLDSVRYIKYDDEATLVDTSQFILLFSELNVQNLTSQRYHLHLMVAEFSLYLLPKK